MEFPPDWPVLAAKPNLFMKKNWHQAEPSYFDGGHWTENEKKNY